MRAQIEQIQSLLRSISKYPWGYVSSRQDGARCYTVVSRYRAKVTLCIEKSEEDGQAEVDAQFIANSPELIEWLLKELEKKS